MFYGLTGLTKISAFFHVVERLR